MSGFPERRPASGAGGREFKSLRSDHYPSKGYDENGERSETGRSPIRSASTDVAPSFRRRGATQGEMIRRLKYRRRPVNEEGLVYFILCDGPDPYIKIGLARDADARLAGLQIGCPYPLELLATTGGGLKRERELQRWFRKSCIGGEWFKLSHELVDFINSLQPKREDAP